MSKTRLASALAGSVCVLAAAAWFVTNTFPLAAAPQVVNDAPGVTVDVGGATLLHRASVPYPVALRTKGVQGVVVLELTLDTAGNVADARAVSGPEELRRPALESALQWHFTREAGNKRQVTIAFTLAGKPAPPAAAPTVAFPAGSRSGPLVLKSIIVLGLSDAAKSELLSRLPVKVGDTLTVEMMSAISKAAMEYDEHLRVISQAPRQGEAHLLIVTPTATTDLRVADAGTRAETSVTTRQEMPPPPDRIKVGGNVQASKLVRQPRPVYPPEAKEAHISGVVRLSAVIGKDGAIKSLEVISGHPLLVPSALEAVRQWVYETTLLNGEPVEVQTQIDVNYTLSQ